jgi:hypothetical protein
MTYEAIAEFVSSNHVWILIAIPIVGFASVALTMAFHRSIEGDKMKGVLPHVEILIVMSIMCLLCYGVGLMKGSVLILENPEFKRIIERCSELEGQEQARQKKGPVLYELGRWVQGEER